MEQQHTTQRKPPLVEMAAEERRRYVLWQEALAKAKETGLQADLNFARARHRGVLNFRRIRMEGGGGRLHWHTEEQRLAYEQRLVRSKERDVERRSCNLNALAQEIFELVHGRPFEPEGRDAMRKGPGRTTAQALAELRAEGAWNP